MVQSAMPPANGFTLLETTLFITLLALGAATLHQLFPLYTTQLNLTIQTTPATLLSQGKLEEILGDFHNDGLDSLVNDRYPQENLPNQWRRTVTITTISQSANRLDCTTTPSPATATPKCITVTVASPANPLLAQSRLFLWKKSP